MDMLEFVRPTLEIETAANAFIDEFAANGERTINGSCGRIKFASHGEWVEYLGRISAGLVPDRLASDTFFVKRETDNKLVGIVDIRKYLTEPTYHNGHIGLSVAPSERKKGYGTRIIAQAVDYVRSLGISEAVISCIETNLPSKKAIESNGFVLREKRDDKDGLLLIFTKVAGALPQTPQAL